MFIRLTDSITGRTVMVNPAHIVSYTATSDDTWTADTTIWFANGVSTTVCENVGHITGLINGMTVVS